MIHTSPAGQGAAASGTAAGAAVEATVLDGHNLPNPDSLSLSLSLPPSLSPSSLPLSLIIFIYNNKIIIIIIQY